MIDIKLFKEMYEEIEFKVQEIRVLPMLNRQEQDFDGWEYEEYNGKSVITISSSRYYSGCGEETTSFEIPLSEINNSVIWFKQKFQKDIDDDKLEKEAKRKRICKEKDEQSLRFKEIQRKKDIETYNRIKKELES